MKAAFIEAGAAILVLALVLLGALAYGKHERDAGDRAGYARGHAEYVALHDQHAVDALRSEQEQRAKQERYDSQQKAAHEKSERDLRQARADLAAAADSDQRLRERVAALVASSRGSARGQDPAVAGVGPPAGDTTGVFADVLGRCVARVRLLADLADQRGISGVECERAYDAVADPP